MNADADREVLEQLLERRDELLPDAEDPGVMSELTCIDGLIGGARLARNLRTTNRKREPDERD